MLGIGKKSRDQTITAHGKHPAFGDYFSINMEASPLAGALSAWIEQGVKLEKFLGAKTNTCAFRFWIKGIKKEDLVLGIVRDSSDSMGRPYPLLVMSTFRMKDRERQWHNIFTWFDPVFRRFEEVAAARHETFRAFETAISRPGFAGPKTKEKESSRLALTLMGWFKKEKDKEAMILPVTELETGYTGAVRQEGGWGLFKRTEMPSTVFLGGVTDRPRAAFYNRPLKAADFIDLFRAEAGGRH
ncbi:MAG: type VI secretion system-associated protein TagF [Desulfobacter sp.]|nr:MAG: type VI secretion system-associated protein TagF [Desulfobacter sp.]